MNAGMFVIGGGILLHKIKWKYEVSFAEVAQSYVSYVASHFDKKYSIIIFDGYGNDPCVKSSPDIVFDERKNQLTTTTEPS